jgi:hypothetical protein
LTRRDKLIHKALDNPGGLTFAELVRLAGYFGYRQVRKAGSHRIFSRGRGSRRFNFQDHHGRAPIAQVKEFLAHARRMGWIR